MTTLLLLFSVVAAQAQVELGSLEQRAAVFYEKESLVPYTGAVVDTDDRMTGQFAEGQRDGRWTWRFPSGATDFVMDFEAGARVYSASWYEHGQEESERRYEAGRLHGMAQSWYADGTLRLAQTYEAGRLHGAYRLWLPSGEPLYTATYADGQLHGTATWWYPSGAKRWETHYAEGARTGVWRQWDPDGDLRMVSTWEAGALVRRHNPHAHH